MLLLMSSINKNSLLSQSVVLHEGLQLETPGYLKALLRIISLKPRHVHKLAEMFGVDNKVLVAKEVAFEYNSGLYALLNILNIVT